MTVNKPMDIGTEIVDGALIAKPVGRIDGANASDFERVVRTAMRGHEGPVIVDCQGLTYISSAGLRVLMMIARNVGARDAAFAVCSLSGPIAKIFQISGFDRVIATRASRDEALVALHGRDDAIRQPA